MKNTKLLSLVLAGVMALALTACNNANQTSDGGVITTSEITEAEATTVETAEVSEILEETEETVAEVRSVIDREGNEIVVPDEINTIISAAPSVTEILTGLGVTDKIIAADMYSADVAGIDPAICTLDFYNLNTEELIALAPDVIVINGISQTGDSDPYKDLKDAGVNVVYIPSSASVEAIKEDIKFLAEYTGTTDKGDELIASIDAAVADVTAKAAAITEKKSVYFEIGAAPYLYTCGKNTFIDEIITLIGAENIYGGEEGWISNSDETVIAGNPDVIITNVMYDGYDFNEIKTRAGWDVITAVKNGAVYQVDANATSRPSQYVVDGIYAVAKAVYPEIFAE
ncbi:MAG: ABC transporter substrate-binding protein [Oscillospiraceae bacterium]